MIESLTKLTVHKYFIIIEHKSITFFMVIKVIHAYMPPQIVSKIFPFKHYIEHYNFTFLILKLYLIIFFYLHLKKIKPG